MKLIYRLIKFVQSCWQRWRQKPGWEGKIAPEVWRSLSAEEVNRLIEMIRRETEEDNAEDMIE